MIRSLGIVVADAMNSYRGGAYGAVERGSDVTSKVVIGAIVLAVLWTAVYLYDRYAKRAAEAKKEKRTPFGDLCSTHGLTAIERQNLEALARQQAVEPTIAIFVRPELVASLAENSSQPELWRGILDKAYGDYAA